MGNKPEPECFKISREIPIVGGSAGAFSNNLSVAVAPQKNLTYAVVVNKNQVHTVCWDEKFEWMIHNTIPARDVSPGRNNKKVDVIQAMFCTVRNRATPLLVICSVAGAAICDIVSASIIYWLAAPENNCTSWRYMKGVACRGDKLFIGCHTGQMFELSVRADTLDVVRIFDHLKEPMVDIAAGANFLATVGMLGTIVFYSIEGSGIHDEKITVKNTTNSALPISRLIIFKQLLLCGTMTGQIVVFDPFEGVVIAEINAHSQPISDLDVHEPTGRLLSTSEDSFFRVWKIGDVRNGDIACTFSTAVENVPIVGGCFVDPSRGSVLIAGYDHPMLFYFNQQSS